MTTANLVVHPYDDTEPMGPDPKKVLHSDCRLGTEMGFSRNPVDSRITWTCGCGLEISYDRFGPANDAIGHVAINGQPKELPVGSYWSNTASAVWLRAP